MLATMVKWKKGPISILSLLYKMQTEWQTVSTPREQSDLGLQYWPTQVHLKTYNHYGNYEEIRRQHSIQTIMIPRFWGTQVLANTVDPDQTLIRVYTVYLSVFIFWTHISMVNKF